MKKFASLFVFAAAMLCFSGCISVTTVDKQNLNGQKLAAAGTTLAHVNIQNNGYYVLNIPIFTGSTENVGYPTLFNDSVTVEALTPVLAAHAKKLGGTKLLDTSSQYSEFGFIIVSRKLNMSGNVIK